MLHELEYLSENFSVLFNFGLLVFNELVTEPTRLIPVEAGLPHYGPLEASHFRIHAQTHSVKKFWEIFALKVGSVNPGIEVLALEPSIHKLRVSWCKAASLCMRSSRLPNWILVINYEGVRIVSLVETSSYEILIALHFPLVLCSHLWLSMIDDMYRVVSLKSSTCGGGDSLRTGVFREKFSLWQRITSVSRSSMQGHLFLASLRGHVHANRDVGTFDLPPHLAGWLNLFRRICLLTGSILVRILCTPASAIVRIILRDVLFHYATFKVIERSTYGMRANLGYCSLIRRSFIWWMFTRWPLNFDDTIVFLAARTLIARNAWPHGFDGSGCLLFGRLHLHNPLIASEFFLHVGLLHSCRVGYLLLLSLLLLVLGLVVVGHDGREILSWGWRELQVGPILFISLNI